ncbi:Probable cinnamyl alcohol dehydrogenase 2 (CAD 2) [Durusdinium trenchii]|uniref:Probable cinnamyl alcohol dehydrogenase 2 (CAD 2) n=1 Tax=Durusdinium trenchii TaxID=1381693 RepID=A0ABP0S0R0_9DINO
MAQTLSICVAFKSIEYRAFLWAMETICMGCQDASCSFEPVRLKRRQLNDLDVLIEMKYCGVCHTDLHIAAGHMENLTGKVEYPCVPGHELAGVVKEVGSKVSKFSVGDHIGVGCMVDSCLECSQCQAGQEQKCSKQVATYAGADTSGRAAVPERQQTIGGYTTIMVVQERFGIRIPKTYPLEMAGPVMCAGITMYDPLKAFGAKAGDKVGIVGLGGLGVMGVKLAKALGCNVVAISRSESKKAFAESCGASGLLASSNQQQMAEHARSFDLILNTIPLDHDESIYTELVKPSGRHVLLGLNSSMVGAMVIGKVTFGKSKVTMSGIGGIPNTQEVIDLCDKHKIYPEIEVHPVTALNRIYEKLDSSNDAGKRYVLDIANTLNESTFSKTADLGEPTKLAPMEAIPVKAILRKVAGLFSRPALLFC